MSQVSIHAQMPENRDRKVWRRERQLDAQHVPAQSEGVASPNRETEAMFAGSDAVSDWPLLDARLKRPLARHGFRCTKTAGLA